MTPISPIAYSPTHVAALLDTSAKTIRRRIRSGEIPSVMTAFGRRIPATWVDAMRRKLERAAS